MRSFRKKTTKPKEKRDPSVPYNVPSKAEINKKKDQLDTFLKKLNEDGSPKKEADEAWLCNLIRSAIREKWMYCPTKLAYIGMNTIPDTDLESRRKWKIQCECCGKWFKQSEITVDHIVGEHSLKNFNQIQDFADNILNISFDDIQLLCEDCHYTKTMMERYDYDEKDIPFIRKLNSWKSSNKKAADQINFLVSKGYKKTEVSNQEKRDLAYLSYIKQQRGNNGLG